MTYKDAQCHIEILRCFFQKENKHTKLKHQHLNDAIQNGYFRTKNAKVIVTKLSHVHYTLVLRKKCTARCKMHIRNPVVCDARKGNLTTHKPPFVE